jgi:predicted DNA-binding ribbon-helix-helix protein
LIKRSFTLAGHRTSVALEQEFWDALAALAEAEGQSLSLLVARLDAERRPGRPLASALRVHALERRSVDRSRRSSAETEPR